jgi:hypothetical protein
MPRMIRNRPRGEAYATLLGTAYVIVFYRKGSSLGLPKGLSRA